MQILQWLSKIGHEPRRVASSTPITQKQDVQDKKIKTGDVVRTRNLKRVEKSKLYCENLNIFCFLRRKDVSEACFYQTLDLKRLGSMQRSHMKMKKEDNISRELAIITHKSDCATNHGGNKVLPINDSSTQTSSEKKENSRKGDQKKTISRMKELLKWTAAAKADDHKGGKYIGREVLHVRSTRAPLKAIPDDDQLSIESPKISFKLEVESCSTISVGCTPLHVTDQGVPRPGNWITTDSEFVVLEL